MEKCVLQVKISRIILASTQGLFRSNIDSLPGVQEYSKLSVASLGELGSYGPYKGQS